MRFFLFFFFFLSMEIMSRTINPTKVLFVNDVDGAICIVKRALTVNGIFDTMEVVAKGLVDGVLGTKRYTLNPLKFREETKRKS